MKCSSGAGAQGPQDSTWPVSTAWRVSVNNNCVAKQSLSSRCCISYFPPLFYLTIFIPSTYEPRSATGQQKENDQLPQKQE